MSRLVARLVRLLIILAVVEYVMAPVWHRPLLGATAAAQAFWQREAVARARLGAWRDLLGAVDRSRWRAAPAPVGGPADAFRRAVRGAVAHGLRAGGVALAVLWPIPYLAVSLALGLAGLAVALHLLPLGAVALWIHRRRRRVAAVPWHGSAAPPPSRPPASGPWTPRFVVPAPRHGPARTAIGVMGAEHAALAGRLDPYTRTGFAPGERFVRCGGGCGRLYKLATWTLLEQVCPVDHATLPPGQELPGSPVTTTQHPAPGGGA